ncbi:MAG TPA: NTF2 fold immunity protein [Chthoniobacterales bacterium]|nr:NTF2 fold immunity protein [Chthoniobacterales bacterium]
MRIRHLGLIAVMCFLVSRAFAQEKMPPKDGYVPDADTAIKIAVVVWTRIYGEKTIAAQKPYRAELEDGIWTVQGTLPKDPEGGPVFGGTAFAMIAKADGRILHVAHGE